ncbi:MAG: DUF1294 domain-containing protein [Eubacteriales bacterium]|nr:DUF1294 domain-containing protein [Eubacteriales bacterium]
MYKVLITYLVAINLLGIIVTVADKKKAIKGKHRIPELDLWIIALLGGSLGTYIAMKIVRHKTKHKNFMIGIPIIIIIQLVTSILAYIFLGWN